MTHRFFYWPLVIFAPVRGGGRRVRFESSSNLVASKRHCGTREPVARNASFVPRKITRIPMTLVCLFLRFPFLRERLRFPFAVTNVCRPLFPPLAASSKFLTCVLLTCRFESRRFERGSLVEFVRLNVLRLDYKFGQMIKRFPIIRRLSRRIPRDFFSTKIYGVSPWDRSLDNGWKRWHNAPILGGREGRRGWFFLRGERVEENA